MEKTTDKEIEDIQNTVDIPSVDSSVNIADDLEIDFNKLPESFGEQQEQELNPIISERETLKSNLTLEDFQAILSYLQGTGPKPSFIDNMTADAEGRLKDIVYIMNFQELSRIPVLTSLQTQIQERLFAPENLYSMDTKELTSASANITKEIQSILDSAIKTMQTMSQFGSLNNEYRNLIDLILNLPEDKLSRIKEIVYRQD